MKKHVWAVCLGVAAVLAGAAALATGTGEAESPAEEPDNAVVLGEEDLADRAEILRNMYRRITPPDIPLVQDVGTWPAAWEEFGENWNAAAADREYGAWVVPVEVSQEDGLTVVKDGDGAVLWRGWTDFARPESVDVVLTGGLVAEEDWAAYEGVRDAVAALRDTAGTTPAPPMRTTPTNGLRFTAHEWTTNGTFRLRLAYEIDTNVDVFAYAVACTSSVVVATWTNDENQVITDTNTVWTSVGLPFNGMESDWEQRGTVAISNGVAEFEDSGFSEELSRLRFYAAAVAEDTDGDGLNDGEESFVYHTDSAVADSDGDGLNDGAEVLAWHTNPARADSDGDGWGDGMEVAVGFNPALATDVPHVVIQGVNYMGTTNEPGKQWVELFSASTRNVSLAGFRLEVGRDGVWSNTVEFAAGTQMEPSRYLLVGESNVANADIHAALDIPSAESPLPTTGVRLRWGGATNGAVADVVFIGQGTFNTSNLDVTGWLSVTSVWNYAGRVQERCYPGLDTDLHDDWHWQWLRPGHNYASGVIDTDGDGLSDAEEWNGSLSPNGEPTNPVNPDSDGDGQGDYAECVTYHTDPTTWASDGDIWPWMPPTNSPADWPGSDVWELANGLNPTNADENANGISDIWEWMVGLDNLLGGADSDGDGITDWDEMQQNSNPLDSGDFGARPYVVLYEASRPGWQNGGITNDIGLGGEVRVRFIGAHAGQGVLVKVTEGYYREPFTLRWKGAEQIATFEGATWSEWYTSARLSGNSVLVVKDAGKHPEYTNTLGGEYTITNFTATIVPDLDRNRQIDDEDRGRAWRGEPLRFWVNDDNDNGPVSSDNSDIPGQGSANGTNLVVDGACDLLDFFPVWVDASEVLANIQGTTSCRLRQSASALNAVYTGLSTASACDFLTNQIPAYGPWFDMYPQTAPTFQIVRDGVDLVPQFASQIRSGNGVLMLEGRSPSLSPLVFEVLLNGEPVFATEMPLELQSVTSMYQWIDFRASDPPNVSLDPFLPNVLFIHGVNVNPVEEDAWAAEMYKRLIQSGGRMAFWPVRWEGDKGWPVNYHENASNAFRVASWLGPVLSGQGRNVILAHSLGTVVAAAAIQDYGGHADKLMMFNSAIPSEAFVPSLFDTSTNNHLVHNDWVDYTNVCWTARWHELFPQGDARHSLTWRGRFSGIRSICKNFFSSQDEVLELYEDSHNPAWYNGLGPSGDIGKRYSWHKQEIWKGRKSFVAFLGPSDWSGWGFKRNIPLINAWSAAEANAVTDPHVFATNTVFDPTPASITNATATRLETDMHLALGIPSLSPATGGPAFDEDEILLSCSDMDGYRGTNWPTQGRDPELQNRWLHSDIKNVAYLFTHVLFENIVRIGGLTL
ncbi:MAG: hypothetical protein IKQ55_07940 [Kiritimatiellae bacterium]|nr:hypothetical protein [Kiritimatiellia bacterium]